MTDFRGRCNLKKPSDKLMPFMLSMEVACVTELSQFLHLRIQSSRCQTKQSQYHTTISSQHSQLLSEWHTSIFNSQNSLIKQILLPSLQTRKLQMVKWMKQTAQCHTATRGTSISTPAVGPTHEPFHCLKVSQLLNLLPCNFCEVNSCTFVSFYPIEKFI